MQKSIKKYEDRLAKILDTFSKNPINPSSKFSLDRMTNGLAVTGLQSRLSEIDGNPDIGKQLASTVSAINTDTNVLNPATDSIENRLNSIFTIKPINTAPPLDIPNLQDESKTSKKFDVQNEYRPIVDIKPLPSVIDSTLKSTKSTAPTIPAPKTNSPSAANTTNLGKTGTIIQSVAPTIFSAIDAITTKKNKNYFADYGREALDTLDSTKRNINVDIENRLNNIVSESNTARRNIDQNTTSLNVGRALKAGVDAAQLKAETDTTVAGIDKKSQLDSVIAQQQNQRDQAVMQGNDLKTERDAQDLSTIISNFSASAISAGKGMEHLQKIENADSYNNDVLSIINSMFSSTNLERDSNGNLVIKKRVK